MKSKVKVGTRVYDLGQRHFGIGPKFGTVTKVEETQWCTIYTIECDDGEQKLPYNIYDTYNGYDRSKSPMTLEAYKEWAKGKFGKSYEQWAMLHLPCRDLENVTMPLETRHKIMFMMDNYDYEFEFDGEKFIITNHDMFEQVFVSEEDGKIIFWTKQILNETEL